MARGYEDKEALPVAWGGVKNGVLLCTEESFRRRISGEDAPAIGFPFSDIKGLDNEGSNPNGLASEQAEL